MLLANVYAPNGSSHTDFYVRVYAQLQALLETVLPTIAIVAGDFNGHLYNPTSPRDRDFTDFCSFLESDSLAAFPTSELPYTYVSGDTSSTIDYVFHRGLRSVNCAVRDDISVAQHKPLVIDFELSNASAVSLQAAPGAAYWRSKTKEKNFPSSLAVLPPAYEQKTPSALQAYYEKFSNLMSLACKRPVKTRTPGTWSSKLAAEDARQLESCREELRNLSAGVASGNSQLRPLHVAKKRDLEALTTRLMKKVLEAETDVLSSRAGDHAGAWKVINNMREASPECPISTDALVEHFSALSHPPGQPLLPLPLPPGGAEQFEPLHPDELLEALRNTNTSSAAGPDGVTPLLMVSTFSRGVAFEFLFNFLALCLVLSVVPLEWREATLFVLYKGTGDPCDPNNYRGIALTSAFGKLYERILLGRLIRWFKNSRLVSLPQFGFRKACSCAQAVFLLRTLALDVLACRRGPLYVAFVDLRKAFPSVGRDALFRRMLALGIPYPLVLAVRSFYEANVARLRVDNCLTRDFFVAVGVLEGSVLSPFLFGVLFSVIWDVFDTTVFPTPTVRVYNCDSLWFIAYADDLAVVTLSRVKLEAVLNKLEQELKSLNLIMRFFSPVFNNCFFLMVITFVFVFIFVLEFKNL